MEGGQKQAQYAPFINIRSQHGRPPQQPHSTKPSVDYSSQKQSGQSRPSFPTQQDKPAGHDYRGPAPPLPTHRLPPAAPADPRYGYHTDPSSQNQNVMAHAGKWEPQPSATGSSPGDVYFDKQNCMSRQTDQYRVGHPEGRQYEGDKHPTRTQQVQQQHHEVQQGQQGHQGQLKGQHVQQGYQGKIQQGQQSHQFQQGYGGHQIQQGHQGQIQGGQQGLQGQQSHQVQQGYGGHRVHQSHQVYEGQLKGQPGPQAQQGQQVYQSPDVQQGYPGHIQGQQVYQGQKGWQGQQSPMLSNNHPQWHNASQPWGQHGPQGREYVPPSGPTSIPYNSGHQGMWTPPNYRPTEYPGPQPFYGGPAQGQSSSPGPQLSPVASSQESHHSDKQSEETGLYM